MSHEFKITTRQNTVNDSILTVTCSMGKFNVYKVFYGLIPFQMFFVRRWIRKSKVDLEKLISLEDQKNEHNTSNNTSSTIG